MPATNETGDAFRIGASGKLPSFVDEAVVQALTELAGLFAPSMRDAASGATQAARRPMDVAVALALDAVAPAALGTHGVSIERVYGNVGSLDIPWSNPDTSGHDASGIGRKRKRISLALDGRKAVAARTKLRILAALETGDGTELCEEVAKDRADDYTAWEYAGILAARDGAPVPGSVSGRYPDGVASIATSPARSSRATMSAACAAVLRALYGVRDGRFASEVAWICGDVRDYLEVMPRSTDVALALACRILDASEEETV